MQPQLVNLVLGDVPIVGRDADLERVQLMCDLVSNGTGRMLLVTGEPGIGKTRLVREALMRAAAAGFVTLLGRSFEQHMAVPFFPFAELLETATAALPQSVRATIQNRWPELGYIVPELVPAPGPLTDGAGLLRVFRSAASVLRELATRAPVLLVLEDLHWADSASLGLLLHLGRQLENPRLLVLATYRDADVRPHHPLEQTLRELTRERIVDEIALRNLSAEATAELIAARLGARQLPDGLSDQIFGRTEGNPFFTEEILKVLVDRSRAAPEIPLLNPDPFAQTEVPRSVRSVIAQRVGRLSPAVQDVLRFASVIGTEFAFEVLLAASQVPDDTLLEQLSEALTAQVIREQRGARGERYAFVHALIAQTLYEEIPTPRRRRLHQRVGEVLEEVGTTERHATAAEQAHHFQRAGDVERALRYALLAGDHAANMYAHAEAAQHYRSAVELAASQQDEQQAAEIRCKLASELNDLDKIADALQAYAESLAYYERVADALGQARVQRAIGWVHQSHHAYAAAEPHVDAAIRLWPSEEQGVEFSHLLLEAGRAKAGLSRLSEAAALADRALAVAEPLDDASLRGRALVEVAAMRTHQGQPSRLVVPVLSRAQTEVERVHDVRTASRLHSTRGMLLFFAGDLQQSCAEYLHGQEASQRAGLSDRVAFNASMVATACMELGDWSAGRDAGIAARAADPRPQWDFVLPWLEGEFDAALEAVRASLVEARRRGDAQAMIRCLTQTADWYVQLDRVADAVTAAREAVDFVRTRSYFAWTAAAFGRLAEALARAHAHDVEAVLSEAEPLVIQREQYYGRPYLLLARGLMLWRQRRLRLAVEALEASTEIARAQHAVPLLGRTLAVLVDVAGESGQEDVARRADAERSEIVARVGPEMRGLPWAGGRRSATATASERRALAKEGAARLTPREQEVAALVAQGLTNRQIAEALVIAEGTAGVHVDHIFSKLGLRSRTQLALWVVDQNQRPINSSL